MRTGILRYSVCYRTALICGEVVDEATVALLRQLGHVQSSNIQRPLSCQPCAITYFEKSQGHKSADIATTYRMPPITYAPIARY